VFLTAFALTLCQLFAVQANPCSESPIKSMIPNPNGDCRDYFVCHNGAAMAQRCPLGFFFDYRMQICNFEGQVECNNNAVNPGPTAPTPDPKLPSLRPIPGRPTTATPPTWQRITCTGRQDLTFIPDRRRGCRAYQVCNQGIVIHRDICANNFFFDFERQICTWPENVDCV
jgi:hypothetical protein